MSSARLTAPELAEKFCRDATESRTDVIDQLTAIISARDAASGARDAVLRAALEACVNAMKMQENRDTGAFHIRASVAKEIWDEALDLARYGVPEKPRAESELAKAIRETERNHPLPRCQHGRALRDGGGEYLEPPCGCRAALPEG